MVPQPVVVDKPIWRKITNWEQKTDTEPKVRVQATTENGVGTAQTSKHHQTNNSNPAVRADWQLRYEDQERLRYIDRSW